MSDATLPEYTDNSNHHTKNCSWQLSGQQRELNRNDLHHYFDYRVKTRNLPKYILDQLKTPSGSWEYNDYSSWYNILSIRKTHGMGNGYILFSITDSFPLYGYGRYLSDVETGNKIMEKAIIFSYAKIGCRWKFTLVYSCFDDLKNKIINITSRLNKDYRIYYTISIKSNLRAMLLKWAYAHPDKTHFHGKDLREIRH